MKKILSIAVSVMLALTVVIPQLPRANAADAFYDRAELLQIKSHIENDAKMSKYVSAQGACTDGKNVYFALPNGKSTILKYDLNSMTLVKKKTGINLGHANDMTYNTKEKYIAVAHNAPDYNTISILDPKTLKVTQIYEIELKIYSIAYCEKEDCYFVGISGGYNFARLDSEFNVVKKYKGVKSGNTRQGCDCDDDYIYFAQSGSGNIIVIYDHEGNYVDEVAIDSSYEVENLFHVGKNFYTTLHYYGNYLYRIGISKQSRITYKVNYDPGEGQGSMKNTTVHYGESTRLRANSFERYGYFFGGWKVTRSSDNKVFGYRKGSKKAEWLDTDQADTYKLYPDKAKMSRTVKFGSVTVTPFWISNYYDINFTSDNAKGYIESTVLGYHKKFAMPDNAYVKPGYVFAGYIAERTYDGKHYGYRKNAKKPEWLYDDELYDDYFFQEGEEVAELTYGGSVLFTAMFRTAFGYNKSGNTLIDYIGTDEDVRIPDREGAVSAIASGAFTDNDIMTTLQIPASIDTIEPAALNHCTKLKTLYFEDKFAENADGNALVDSGIPTVYLNIGDDNIFLGWYADKYSVTYMKLLSQKFTSQS